MATGMHFRGLAAMTGTIVAIFAIVYLGMILGGLPLLRLDRTGVALVGAIAMIGTRALSVGDAARAIDAPTLLILFAFMVVSAQMRLAGFYERVAQRLAGLPLRPPMLLGALVFGTAGLAAIFSNDVVCLAATPALLDTCRRRGLDPVPFLLALACAANIGSAATLIGNPQNMLIGQALRIPFGGYLLAAAVPVLLGLLVTWALVLRRSRGLPAAAAGALPDGTQANGPAPFDRWQTVKGWAVASAIVLCFLFSPWPREAVALTGAGILLMGRKFRSRAMLGLVDWQLLVLFMGLFVVNHALQATGLPARAMANLAASGVPLQQPGVLFAVTSVLSNIVSNVPAVMLLLPAADHFLSGLVLALASTLAGNLLVVGSISNLIVVDAAARHGVRIDWRDHAVVGVPVTLATLALAAGYLSLRARLVA
jgi:Na+/H+ antiporter NhaD/arsenite permease-like protein